MHTCKENLLRLPPCVQQDGDIVHVPPLPDTMPRRPIPAGASTTGPCCLRHLTGRRLLQIMCPRTPFSTARDPPQRGCQPAVLAWSDPSRPVLISPRCTQTRRGHARGLARIIRGHPRLRLVTPALPHIALALHCHGLLRGRPSITRRTPLPSTSRTTHSPRNTRAPRRARTNESYIRATPTITHELGRPRGHHARRIPRTSPTDGFLQPRIWAR
jgi:hypothetical protein